MANKPIVTIWNKIDAIPGTKAFYQFEAAKRPYVVALSALTGEGIDDIMPKLESALVSTMESIEELIIPYDRSDFLDAVHRLGSLDEVVYLNQGIQVTGKIPRFLKEQILEWIHGSVVHEDDDEEEEGEGDGLAADINIDANIDVNVEDEEWDFSHYDLHENFLEEE